VDLALLPINGHDPVREVAGNLNCKEAAQLSLAINAKMTIPCHYDMFAFNSADVKEFELEATKLNVKFTVLKGGQRLTL
jgi:L-ascorbate metabolism protein UlaG (beta-lactamase superfamily)